MAAKKAARKPTRPKAPRAPASVLPPAVPASIVEQMDQEELDHALATGQHREAMEEYFGPQLYRELSMLAGEVQRRRVRAGPPVAILPGIMGSTLSINRDGRPRVIWFNLLEVILGRSRFLHVRSGDKSVFASGVFTRYYSKLRLSLEKAGYNARYVPFDWRKSLDGLGRDLLAQISAGERGRIHLVAHSMGGLVARAAAKRDRGAFDRLIQLGTPNYGSFSPVTAVRGVNPTARKIERLDPTQDMADYIDLFSSFPGLLQMIPNPDRYQERDLFNLQNWPAGTKLTGKVLSDARKVQKQALANADDRTFLIAGTDQETIVRVRMKAVGENQEFEFLVSNDGDGTVPLELARLDSAKTYYVAEEHGALPNNSLVAAAVNEILKTGDTKVLAATRSVRREVPTRVLSERDLQREAAPESLPSGIPTARQERHLLDEFLSVSSKDRGVAVSATTASLAPEEATPTEVVRSRGIVVGRRRQRALEVRLAFGSITEADARGLALGIFEKVTPTGAAAALNEALGGTIQHYIDRRMFDGGLGEVTIIPANRRQLRTEFVIFSGLGPFDQFSPGLLQTVGKNLARLLIDTRVEDIAMVPFGGSAGFASDVVLRNFLKGFFDGLADADTENCFRRLTICEVDRRRFTTLVDELLHLTTTDLFDGVEAVVDQITLPEPRVESRHVGRAAVQKGPEPIYLIARRYSPDPGGDQTQGDFIETSVLTGGATAAIVNDLQQIDPTELEKRLQKIDTGLFGTEKLDELGDFIAQDLIGERVARALTLDRARPLIIVHDAGASRIPWEAMRLDGYRPALECGLSRRYMSRDLSVAKWLSARLLDERLDVLLVVNPTGDLAGAEEEGERVEQIIAPIQNAGLTVLRGPEATRSSLLSYLSSGRFDVLHYAGHAFFDPNARERSGILCAGNEVLSGVDLAGVSSLPALVVCNACESARVRTSKPRSGGLVEADRVATNAKPDVRTEIARNVSFAEAFLRGGIANYVGTHWPVGDSPAKLFASEFYRRLTEGKTMNAAITAGRSAIVAESKDWADYIHYGDPNFVLKTKNAGADMPGS